MPIGTAVHARTFPLCESLNYRDWSGYYAVSAYESHHEHEYNAIRNASALIDVSPLYKYLITGRDAARFVDRIITRDVSKMTVGQVYYTPWCDEHGKVIDDGTVTRLEEQTFRWTAADPSLRWFTQNAVGLDVHLEDISEQVAALALQGPTTARLLRAVSDVKIDALKYFRVASGTIAGVAVDISRTGYTGDLGYEVWMAAADAIRVDGGRRRHPCVGRVDGRRSAVRHQAGGHARAGRRTHRGRPAADRRRFLQQQESDDRSAEVLAV
jgi:aminomethyltransferase